MKLSLLIVVVGAAGTTHSVPVPAPILGIPVRTEFMPGKPGFSVATKLVSLGSLMKRDSPVKYKRACPFLAGGSAKLGSDYVHTLSRLVKREKDAQVDERSPSPEPGDHVKDPSIFNVTRRLSPSGSDLIPKDLNSTAVVSS
ncbi:BQ5605_C028g10503 [Microbotryum silenes-dioicae]|uniref:BQ5605_C028g10503 protein n=1 Tax=Microbotryum silenes-dioicae TaxID=796604 RepID=A0A2X0PCW2_9BASI|nr:BQ5605_C028g10503 [Microbotryum silenes-dioicae]